MSDEYWTKADLERVSSQARNVILLLARLAKCCQYLERSSSEGDPQAPTTLKVLHEALEPCLHIVRAYEE